MQKKRTQGLLVIPGIARTTTVRNWPCAAPRDGKHTTPRSMTGKVHRLRRQWTLPKKLD